MNKERMIQLRNYIAEREEDRVNMCVWIEPTAACIGGSCELMQAEILGTNCHDPRVITAGVWLGLGCGETGKLFLSYPRVAEGGWKKWALRRLDHAILTGYIAPWQEAIPAMEAFEAEMAGEIDVPVELPKEEYEARK